MQWFYSKDGQQVGPVEFSEIQRLHAEGQLTGDSLVWEQGSPNWIKLSAALNPSAAPSVLPASPLSAEVVPGTQPKTNVLAIVSLVLGILGLFCCGIFVGAGAAICGHIALGQIKTRGEGGAGLAKAGTILGYIGVVVSLGLMIYYVTNIPADAFSMPVEPVPTE